MTPARRLTYDFMELPHVRKLQVACGLGLREEADAGLPEREQWILVFTRARERGLVGELRRAVAGQLAELEDD